MWRKALLVALASVASVAAVAGCGSSDINGAVSPEEANLLKANLTGVQEAAELGDCDALTTRTHAFLDSVNGLPATAGADLKNALRESANHLTTLANEQCASGTTGPTRSTSSSSTTTSPPPTTSPTTTDTTAPSTTSTTTTSTKEESPPSGGGKPSANGNGSGGGVGGGTGGTGGIGDGAGGGD